MTVEVALVISGISFAFSIYQGMATMKRNNKQDAQTDSAQLTTVIVKLENIGNDISEIKADLRGVKEDLKDLTARLIRAEQQLKVLNNAVFGSRREQ